MSDKDKVGILVKEQRESQTKIVVRITKK